jgi:sulfopyruvate decarboxylase subunit alpha
MPVSVTSSRLIYDALKGVGVRVSPRFPETWLVHLIRMAEDDPEMTLVRLAKEEEGVGISAWGALRRREVRHADAEPRASWRV